MIFPVNSVDKQTTSHRHRIRKLVNTVIYCCFRTTKYFLYQNSMELHQTLFKQSPCTILLYYLLLFVVEQDLNSVSRSENLGLEIFVSHVNNKDRHITVK